MKEVRQKAFALVQTEHGNRVIGVDETREIMKEEKKKCTETGLQRAVWGRLRIVPCEIVFKVPSPKNP